MEVTTMVLKETITFLIGEGGGTTASGVRKLPQKVSGDFFGFKSFKS
mgnify:CR=1 FL=1